ncbi:MAG: metallophosphoesterase [Arachnia sp.]
MLRILHLSDTHLMAPGGTHHGRDTTQRLQLVLGHFGRTADVVVVTGDVSEDGSADSYESARRLIGGFAAQRSIPVMWCIGNHDQTSNFRRVLLPGLDSPTGKLDSVLDLGAWRVIGLDTHEPNLVGGRLSGDQLSWLTEQLRGHDGPSVVALHHPPVDPSSVIQAGIALADPAALLDRCARYRVRAVLGGHIHHQLLHSVVVGGYSLPVFTAPAVTHVVHHLAGREVYTASRRSGLAYVELAEDGGYRVAADVVDEADELFSYDTGTTADAGASLAAHDAQVRRGFA